MIVGLLAGLAIALAVALYITKAPVPFIDKVPQRTAEQDSAEVERNKRWDPNAPLAGKQPPLPAAAASAPTAAPSAPPTAARTPASAPAAQGGSTRDPAAILAGQSTDRAAEAFVYFVQTGAFTRTEDAEQERARLAMLGFTAKVSEREQAGKTMYRVRTGPYGTRDDAEAVQGRLQAANIDARLVRAEKP
nr:SPOR domain-containing protein [Rubrivivax benzoatilyticus]